MQKINLTFHSVIKFLKRPATVILLVTLTTLLINDLENGWGHFEHSLIQYGVLLILFISLSAYLIFKTHITQAYHIQISYIDGTFFLFSAYVLLNYQAEISSIWNEKILRNFFMLIAFFIFRVILINNESKHLFWFVILGLGIVNCIFGLVQFYENYSLYNRGFSITGTFNNSSLFSCYTVATLPVFYYFLIISHNRKIKTLILIFMVSCFFLLSVAFSRTAILSAIVGAIYFASKRYNFVSIKKFISLVIPTVAVTLSALLYFIRPDSANGRLLIWQVSLTMLAENPVTGIGTGQFAYRYNDYQADFFDYHKSAYEMLASNTYYAFNEYIETVVEGGLIGLTLFVLLLVTVFYKIHSSQKTEVSLACCQTGILTILVFGLFSYPLSSTAIYSLLVVYLSFLSSYSESLFEFSIERKLMNILIGIFFIGLFWLGTIGVNRYIAIKEWKKASTMIKYGYVDDALDIYSKVYPVLKDHGAFLYNYGAELSEAERYNESIPILKKATKYFNHIDLYIFLGKNYEKCTDYENAEKCYRHASLMIPNRFVPKYLLAKLYMLQGNCRQATRLADEIVTMPVKVDSHTVSLIKKEMKGFLQNQSAHHEGC